MNKSTQVLIGALALLLATPVSAQKLQLQPYDPLRTMPKMSAAEKASRAKQFKADYPLIAYGRELNVSQAGLTKVRPVVPYRNVSKTALRRLSGSAPTFWAYLAYYKGWPDTGKGNGSIMNKGGVYEFTPAGDSPYNIDSLVVNTHMSNIGGAAVVDGIYYKYYLNTSLISYGMVGARLYCYDINTWEPAAGNDTDMTDYLNLCATDVAQAADGTVYGQFYTADFGSLEYGVADYANKTRTTIGTSTRKMVAMGVTNDGKLYGIAVDGNLYQVSTTDGKETLVGATGVTVSGSEGNYYYQTGEIDPKTNIFYWYALDKDGNDGLYTVDLTTGAATLIGNFVGGQAELYDMIIAGKLAEDGAPAKATNLTASFPNGNTTGTISFTAPARDYAGENNLTGTLNYTIASNNSTIATGTCNPGAAVSADVTAPEGSNKFVVTTSNAAGTSPRATVSTWVGYDIPKAPATVDATFADDNTSATITWDAVTEGMHNAFLGPITYKVVRLMGGDSTVVADGTSQTTATDALPANDAGMMSVKYMVRAINGTKISAWSTSDRHVIGDAFSIPYSEDFTASDAPDLFTIIDANDDGQTWKQVGLNTNNPFMRCLYNSTKDMDDWLITPPIRLTGGQEYLLTFNSFGSSSYPEKIEVKFGTVNTVEGMTNEVLPVTKMTTDTLYEDLAFTPTTDGIYYVGFHGCSDMDMNWTKVDDINIKVGAKASSPAAPTIKVVPADKGGLSATITITAPSKNVGGNTLTAEHLSKITLIRGGEVIHTFTSPAPGATLTYTDAVSADGTYKYTAIPYDGDDAGKRAETSAYIGQDMPLQPQNVQVADNSSSVHLSWDAVSQTGATGGYVDPADVKTLVYNYVNGKMESTPSDTIKNANSFDVAINTNEGTPNLKIWGLVNKNRAGQSPMVFVYLPVGTPNTLPYVESMPDCDLSNPWWTDKNGGDGTSNYWILSKFDAADNDGGSFYYHGSASGVDATMNTYKIDLGNATNPTLVFSNNVKTATKGKLKVEVRTPDGQTSTVYDADILEKDLAWHQHMVSLKEFAGKVVMITFHAFCEEPPVELSVDAIRIQDTYTNDLSASLSVPASVIKGQDINAVVKVTNEGSSAQSAYTVKVFADNEEVSATNVAETLDVVSSKSIAVSIPTSALPADKASKTIKAQVICEGDLQSSNDIATATVATDKSDRLAPENLAAADAQPHVFLTWDAPKTTSVQYTEDFETFSPFILDASGAASPDLGNGWTTIDGQAGQQPAVVLGTFWNNDLYPGQGKEGAFMVFNADSALAGAFKSNPFMHGHNDSYQFAGMPYEVASSNYMDGDNYLVSPALTGEAQTISFFAKNALANTHDFPERFELLYSTSGNAKDDFSNVAITDTTLTGGEWQQFEAALPAEATYFAIHQTSSSTGMGNYLFSVDDVTFLKGEPKPTGYNIYCDGELVGRVDNNRTTWFYGEAPDGDHVWSVTATYPDGQESEPVSVTATSDISSIIAGSDPFDVYTLDGILVRSQVKDVKGLKTGVYIINNNKVIIK